MLIEGLEELESELKRGVIRPVYLFTGPEVYLRRLAQGSLETRVLTPEAKDFNLSEFSLASRSLQEVLEAANTFPLASPYRMVVASDLKAPTEDQEELLLAYLKRPSPKTVLVLVGEEIDRRTSLYRQLREKHCVIDFQSPRASSFERWADQVLRRRGYLLSQAGLHKLVDLAGSDFQSLISEMEKLMLFAGDDRSIPDSALDELVRESRGHTAFQLTDAMGRRDIPAALRLLASLIEAGEPPLRIMGAIVWNFRNVLMVQEQLDSGKNKAQIAAALQINPFSLDKIIPQARALSRAAVRELHRRVAEMDLQIKSSGLDERTLIEKLICSL